MILSTAHLQRIEDIAYERGLREGMERTQGLYEQDAWRLSGLDSFSNRYGRSPPGVALEREIRMRNEIQGAQMMELRRWRNDGGAIFTPGQPQ